MTADIVVDSRGVVIPAEVFLAQDDGIAVLTLARGAYLIMRAGLLAVYPRQRLLELSQVSQALERARSEESIACTPRKRRALHELTSQGYPVSAGLEYGLQAMAQPVTSLEQVRQGLSTIVGSLAQEVLAEREER